MTQSRKDIFGYSSKTNIILYLFIKYIQKVFINDLSKNYYSMFSIM